MHSHQSSFRFCTAWTSARFWRHAESPFRRARCNSPGSLRVNQRAPAGRSEERVAYNL